MRSRRHRGQRKKSAKSGDEKDNLFKKAQVFCEKAETICGNIPQKQIAIKSEKCFEQENLPSAASNLKRTFTFIKESQEAEIASPNIVSSPKIPKKNLRSNSTNEDCSDLSSNRSNLLKSSIVESELHKEVLKLWQKNQHNNIHVLIDKTFSYRRSCIQMEKKQFLEIFTEFPYLTFADYVL